jgi:hypothetical protein
MNELFRTNKINSFSRRLGGILRRIPFTLGMVILLLLVAWGTQSYFQELAHTWVSRLGFAPRDFWLFRWERLVLSALVTDGGSIFWIALAFVGFTSGVAEWKTSSWRAALTFWGVHLVTLVIESLLFLSPLRQLGFLQARALFFSRDVGPSAGYMGSLGFVITFLPKPWRWVAFGAILIYLIISLFLPPQAGMTLAIKTSDDLAHLLAFPLGWITAYLFKKNYASNVHVY